jgi:hypothetical protein
MKHLIAIGVIVAAIWFYLYSPRADHLMVRASDNFQAMFHEPATEAPLYGETRIRFGAGSRDMSLVAVARLKPWDDCRAQLEAYTRSVIGSCRDCEVESFECNTDPDRRYENMLSGGDAVTSYVQLRNAHEDFRRMAIVLWGLTDREARAWCGQLVESVRSARGELPDHAFRFSAEGRALRRLGNLRADCR